MNDVRVESNVTLHSFYGRNVTLLSNPRVVHQ
jgi:hypothetical protein